MIERLRLLWRLPGYGLLAWRLFRDPRVPGPSKAIAVGAIILIFSPLDVLAWLPIAGEAGELALVALVLRAFVKAAPDSVRQEHMTQLGIREV